MHHCYYAFVMVEIIETASFQTALFISHRSEVNRREVMPVWGHQEVMNTHMVLVGEGLGHQRASSPCFPVNLPVWGPVSKQLCPQQCPQQYPAVPTAVPVQPAPCPALVLCVKLTVTMTPERVMADSMA